MSLLYRLTQYIDWLDVYGLSTKTTYNFGIETKDGDKYVNTNTHKYNVYHFWYIFFLKQFYRT